jgi:phasin family protein
MLNTQQFAAANQANFDTLMGIGAKAYEGFEKLTALNLQVFKTSLGEAAETSLAAASITDAQSALAFPAGLAQPAAEKATAYGRQVYDILTTTKAEIETIAGVQTEGLKSSLLGVFEAASKNAPQGSVNGMDMFKTAMAAASSAFEGMQKAGRQMAETAEANVNAMSAPLAKAAGKGKRG